MKMLSKFIGVLFLLLVKETLQKDLPPIKMSLSRLKSEVGFDKTFDEFRAASDGINKKLLALKNDISSYDRTDTDSFSREIVDLEKSIKNLQSTILTNRKEISLQAILSINQRYLKLASKWETHKMTLSATTESPLPALKQKLFDLSDKIISLQFEVLQFNGIAIEKEKFSNSLKSLQSLVTDTINNLGSFDPTKTKDKVRLAQEAFATLLSNWNALKSSTTTAPLSTSVATTINPLDDTRLGMASTIRDLLIKLSDLRYQISNSTYEPSKSNSYLLAISSGERLLSLLQSVLMKIDLNSLFSRVFEVKDLIQDIIFDWNSNNPQPLTTTTSPNDSLAEIKKVLDDLDSSLYSMKLDVLSFSGDSCLVEEFLKRNSAIQSAVNQLRMDLIFVAVEKSTVQSNLLTSSFRTLREDLDKFLNDYRTTTGKPDLVTSRSLLVYPGFNKIGNHMEINDANVGFEKSYWLSTYFSQDWDKAKALCKSHDMDLASLDSVVEASKFLELAKQNASLFDSSTYIGSLSAKAQNRTELFRPGVEKKDNSLKVSNQGDDRVCSALGKEQESFFFTDAVCAAEQIKYKFVCQSV